MQPYPGAEQLLGAVLRVGMPRAALLYAPVGGCAARLWLDTPSGGC